MGTHLPHVAQGVSGAPSAAVPQPADEMLRMTAVRRRTGLGRSTIYRLIAAKQFPAPVRLTGRAIGWRSADIERWRSGLVAATH
jgi:prophage regulatory protein